MRAMKDSGIEWIGEIPEKWEVGKIKYQFSVTLGKMLQTSSGSTFDTLENYACAANIKWSGFDTSVCKMMWFSTFEKKAYLLKEGDVLVMEGGLAGTTCIYHNENSPCYMQNSVNRCRNLSGYPNKLLYYWLFHVFHCGYIESISNKATIMHFTKEKIEGTPLIIPPLSEQRNIADFLDAKCAEIDALCADIQKQIDTLEQYKRSVISEAVTKGLDPNAEMKDSGIEWIGEIPKKWKVIRGKYVLKYLQKPVMTDDGVVTCFRDGEVTLRSNRREDGFTMSDKEIGYQGVDIGDLVVHGMDGAAGSIGISDSRGKVSPVLNVLDSDQDKWYLMYYLRAAAYREVFLALATGIRVRSCDLRWNKLAELPFLVPPKAEQKIIVDHIKETIAKTDKVISGKKEQLTMLDAYKKSLIFEYVTGKKEVPAV